MKHKKDETLDFEIQQAHEDAMSWARLTTERLALAHADMVSNSVDFEGDRASVHWAILDEITREVGPMIAKKFEKLELFARNYIDGDRAQNLYNKILKGLIF